jgi:HAD superfamily hydrolase (TIGR01459 family)
VHNGVVPYPGVLDCMAQLRAQGLRILLLSNGPRRAAAAQTLLRPMGIEDDLYDSILTSGEMVYRLLREKSDPWFARLSANFFHMGPSRDESVFDGLDLDRVPVGEAGWILATGIDDNEDPRSLAPYEPTLQQARAKNLPMLCANPDLHVVRGEKTLLCAGAIAARYEAIGGDVRWIGKPYGEVYRHARAMLDVPDDRILAVGDSLRTDIAGAKTAGIESCWVLGGIHADEADPLRAAQEAGALPDFVASRFNW